MRGPLLVLTATILLATPILAGHVAVPPPALSAVRVDGPFLEDAAGRVVLLKGASVINKAPPFVPWHGEREFARMEAWGFTAVRLGILWAGVEPRAGVYDAAYLEAIAAKVALARTHHLYVVLDMHQDLWSGEFGGDGAPADACDPAAAHVDFAAAGLPWQSNYASPAVLVCFVQFWSDTARQERYIAMWERVAARFAGDPTIAGFDLFNEPFPGTPPPAFESAQLGPFYARLAERIRAIDPTRVVFLEPAAQKSAGLPSGWAQPPAPNAVYAPHIFSDLDVAAGIVPQPAAFRATLEQSRAEAAVMGIPLWVGEFGVPGDTARLAAYSAAMLNLLDGAAVGWSWWEYSRDAGFGLERADGAEKRVVSVLDRPGFLRVAGEPTFASFDPVTKEFEARWEPAPGDTIIRVPMRHYTSLRIEAPSCVRWTMDGNTWLISAQADGCVGEALLRLRR